MSQVVIALITLLGVIITGILAIVNTRIQKKMEQVEVLKVSNDHLELQNNIIEQLVPVFEKKDFALDRIADIMEQMLTRQELTDISIKNFSTLLEQRCEAPKLLAEIKAIQKNYTRIADRNEILSDLIVGEEVRIASDDKENV